MARETLGFSAFDEKEKNIFLTYAADRLSAFVGKNVKLCTIVEKNDRSGICNLIDKEEYNDITKNMSDTFAHLPWHQSLPVQAWDSFD